jgi:tRNA A-37 threonylcarbamoyl transferase component Bud32
MGGPAMPPKVITTSPRISVDRNRRVIRRELPADCLLHGELHPNIKERLERIRQIPHPAVAALLGVERDRESGTAWLVWELIEGERFVEAASDARRSARDAAALMRELALEVEAFHTAGLVHGAIGNDSVIVDRDGRIRLTDVSPLLYHDPAVDESSVRRILREVITRRGERDSGLWHFISSAEHESWSLRAVRINLASLVESSEGKIEPPIASRNQRRLRVVALLAACVVALAGVAVSVLIYARVQRAMSKPLSPPVLENQP